MSTCCILYHSLKCARAGVGIAVSHINEGKLGEALDILDHILGSSRGAHSTGAHIARGTARAMLRDLEGVWSPCMQRFAGLLCVCDTCGDRESLWPPCKKLPVVCVGHMRRLSEMHFPAARMIAAGVVTMPHATGAPSCETATIRENGPFLAMRRRGGGLHGDHSGGAVLRRRLDAARPGACGAGGG